MSIIISVAVASAFVYKVKLHDPFEYIATWIGVVAVGVLLDIALSLRNLQP